MEIFKTYFNKKYFQKIHIIVFTFLALPLLSYTQFNRKDSLLNALKTKNEVDSSYINTLNILAFEHFYYNIDSIKILGEQAIELSNDIGYEKGYADGLINLGLYDSETGNSESAIDYFTRARKIAGELKDTTMLLTIHNNLGIEYQYKLQYIKGINEYTKGIELANKVGDKQFSVRLSGNLASLYGTQKDFHLAIELYKKTIAKKKELGENGSLGYSLCNIAECYMQIGDFDNAYKSLDNAISIFERNKLDSYLTFAYLLKGSFYTKEKKYEQALYWLSKNEHLLKEPEQTRNTVLLFEEIAKAKFGLDDLESAKYHALSALELSKNIQIKQSIMANANLLAQINEKQGNYEQALNYHKVFKTLSDSITRLDNDKEIVAIKEELQFEYQKEKLILANEKNLAKQRNFIYIFIALFLLSLGFIIYYKKNISTQKQLNTELLSNKKALEKNEKKLQESNLVKDKLFAIIGHDLMGPIISLKQLMELSLQDKDDEGLYFKKFGPRLKSNLEHFHFTLENLLNWGKTQIEGAVSKPVEIQVKNELEKQLAFFNLMVKNKSIQINIAISDNTTVIADIDHFRVILRNIISNAIKFSPEDSTIDIFAANEEKNSVIQITDYGAGMDQATIDKVLRNTEHFSTTGTKGEKGTGLGLLLSKELIIKNKGKLLIKSTVAKGSTFTVVLPSRRT